MEGVSAASLTYFWYFTMDKKKKFKTRFDAMVLGFSAVISFLLFLAQIVVFWGRPASRRRLRRIYRVAIEWGFVEGILLLTSLDIISKSGIGFLVVCIVCYSTLIMRPDDVRVCLRSLLVTLPLSALLVLSDAYTKHRQTSDATKKKFLEDDDTIHGIGLLIGFIMVVISYFISTTAHFMGHGQLISPLPPTPSLLPTPLQPWLFLPTPSLLLIPPPPLVVRTTTPPPPPIGKTTPPPLLSTLSYP